MKYYYIYKITNKINNKIYYGQHTTSNLNDGYMGSGKALIKAFKKYGLENFEKKILKFYNSQEELNVVEARLVNERWLEKNKDRCYNLQTGGKNCLKTKEIKNKISEVRKGCHWYNNGAIEKFCFECPDGFVEGRLKGQIPWNKGKTGIYSEETKLKIANTLKGHTPWNKGKKHSDEVIQKMSEALKGRHWYNNGIQNAYCFECPDGFVKGRLKFKKYT